MFYVVKKRTTVLSSDDMVNSAKKQVFGYEISEFITEEAARKEYQWQVEYHKGVYQAADAAPRYEILSEDLNYLRALYIWRRSPEETGGTEEEVFLFDEKELALKLHRDAARIAR